MIIQNARIFLQSIERRERQQYRTLAVARGAIARKLGIGAGTLEILIRGRAKRLDAAIWSKIQALAIQQLEAEIARKSHELEIARRLVMESAGRLDEIEIVECEAHLDALSKLLKGEK